MSVTKVLENAVLGLLERVEALENSLATDAGRDMMKKRPGDTPDTRPQRQERRFPDVGNDR